MRTADTMGRIYFIAEEGDEWVKIGWALDPEQRAIDLMCGNPRSLRVVASFPGKTITEFRLRGLLFETEGRREWKKFDDNVRQLIEALKKSDGPIDGLIEQAMQVQFTRLRESIARGQRAAADKIIAAVLPLSSMAEAG